ncbi:HK97 family phage prohead protease [Myroides pelagicus]|uniref:Prohead serine protease domain-containing protein n=1 Tax=Myroides pelagicus TaxID=270914 RepID=A0A7K1GHT2_9FLAO|nr:HK97 family phage prohead protease [Myroides pelagicus]MTH28410.1 hypothetical protein [Myroides pelagicus]
MSRVIRYAVARALTEEQVQNRQVDFVISTEAVDRHKTVFRLSGWELDFYNNNNPIVLYMHSLYSDDPDLVIGTSVVRIEGNELVATLTFEDAENNPLAEKVFNKVKNGILRMASVSADVKEGHRGIEDQGEDSDIIYFTKQELIEWSICTAGSNPDALKRNAESLEEIKQNLLNDNPVQEDTEEVKYNSVANRAKLIDLKIKMSK